MKKYGETEAYVAPEVLVIKVVTKTIICGSDQIDPIGGEGGGGDD